MKKTTATITAVIVIGMVLLSGCATKKTSKSINREKPKHISKLSKSMRIAIYDFKAKGVYIKDDY